MWGRLLIGAYFSVFLPPCRTVIISATLPSVLASRANDVSCMIGLNRCRVIALAR